jgi:hypothetical protein
MSGSPEHRRVNRKNLVLKFSELTILGSAVACFANFGSSNIPIGWAALPHLILGEPKSSFGPLTRWINGGFLRFPNASTKCLE